MADRFFDTSAVVKRYHVETGTARVDALLAVPGDGHFISGLAGVELHSTLARLVRTGVLSAADFALARNRFLADVAAGLWRVTPISAAWFRAAQDLVVRHGLTRSLRALDALQLAAALRLHAARSIDAFVCADAGLIAVATAEGLAVINPEIP